MKRFRGILYKSQKEVVCFVQVHSRQHLVEKMILCDSVHVNSRVCVSGYVTAFLWFFRFPCLVILNERGTETKHYLMI